MKKAFTLVELLVVIGIIAIVAGVLLTTFSGTSETAKAAQCLSNLKALANAALSYRAEYNVFPGAKSGQNATPKVTGNQVEFSYRDMPGWISWDSRNFSTTSKQEYPQISMFTSDEDAGWFAITNGAVWRYMSGNRSAYVCPTHKQKVKRGNLWWSYVMNGRLAGSFKENRAERTLLFGEIPFQGAGNTFPAGTAASKETDCRLDAPKADGTDGEEHLGGNHKTANQWFAHVAFADGHVEKLRVGKDGKTLSDSDLKDLTGWLCAGIDISYNGEKYEKLD